ncbi:hypothetical protein niasHT_008399 [Heterodera trifolii]|uniref:Las1-like protein n=1 Tax=Heterodera trifolii TaxID=157864 RepID=A0ABD2LNU9_9BILA
MAKAAAAAGRRGGGGHDFDGGRTDGRTTMKVINYLNEVCQDAVQNVSIAAAVSKFAIPSWVVDLRHAATHGQMPPLNLMRQANLFIRRWLWRQYWALPFNEAIKENLSSETVEKQQEAFKAMTGHQLITAMNRFREWRRKFRNLDEFHPNVEGRPMKSVCMSIERLLEQCSEEFLLFFAKSCLAPSSVSVSSSNGGSSSSSPKKSNVQQQHQQILEEEEAAGENGCVDDNANAFVNEDEMPSSLFCIDEEDETLVATTTTTATTTTSGINNNLSSMMSDGEIVEEGDDDDNDDDANDDEVVVVVDGDGGGEGGIPLFKCDGSTHLKFFSREKFIDEITVMEQNYYRPILILINNKGCLQRLLVELTRLVSQGEDGLEFGELRRLAGWANLLLHAYLETPDSVSTQNWRLVLKHTVLSPQFFKDDLIDKLLGVLGDAISDRRREQLVHLLKIRRRQSAVVASAPSQQNGNKNNGTGGGVQTRQQKAMMPSSSSTPLSMVGNNTNSSGSNTNDETNILDMSMQSVKSLSDLQERIRMEDLADSTFVRDPLTLEDAWSIAQPDELGPLGLTADQRPETLCLTLGEWGEEMRRGY